MKKIVTAFLTLGLLLQSAAFAEQITVSEQKGSTVVEGTLDLGEQPYAADMTITAYDPDGKVNYMDIIPLSKDGKANFNYFNLGKSGDYTYVFSIPSLNIKKTAVLSGFIGNDYWDSFIEKISGFVKSGDMESLKNDLLAEKDNLALDLTDYDALENSAEVFEVMKNDNKGDYTSCEEIINEFYRAVALCRLKSDGDIKAYYQNGYVNLKAYLPGATENEISVLDSLSESTKDAIFADIAKEKSEFTGSGQAVNSFIYNIIFCGIEKAESWQEVRKILNTYSAAQLLNVDEDMSENVYKALVNKPYSAYSQIETAVKNAKGGSTRGGGSSSGGSSGKGSSSGSNSGIAASPPAGNTPIDNKTGMQSGKMTFSDMEDATWALDAVEKLYQKKIVAGTGDNKFSPHQKVKREEMAKMLVSLTGYTEENMPLPFNDVDAGAWYYPFLSAAYSHSVISGISAEQFGIGLEITREQAAALVYRVLKNQNIEMPGTEFRFGDDADISEWAKESVYALYSIGAISGKSADQFAPLETMTRVETAVLLNNVLKYFESNGGVA